MIWTLKNGVLSGERLFFAAYVSSFILIVPVTIYSIFKKKYLDKTVYLIFFVLVSIIGIWYIGGPDPRFAGGILFALMFYIVFILFSTKETRNYTKAGTVVLILFVLTMIYWPITRTVNYRKTYNVSNLQSILYKPFSYKELLKSAGLFKNEFSTYKLDENITLFTSKTPGTLDKRLACFDDPFPCITLQEDDPMKYQNIHDVEARGTTLKDGFRPKPINK